MNVLWKVLRETGKAVEIESRKEKYVCLDDKGVARWYSLHTDIDLGPVSLSNIVHVISWDPYEEGI